MPRFLRSLMLSLSLLSACGHAGTRGPDPAAPPAPAPTASEPTSEPTEPTPEPAEPTSEPIEPTSEPTEPTSEPTTAPESCRLPEVRGPCEAAFQRYRFDPSSSSCVQFIYGGCQGNQNNFETKEACEAACKR